MLRACILSLVYAGLMVVGGDVSALDHSQRVGSPLKLGEVVFELTYSNDFSGEDRIDRETSFIMDGKRTRLPDPGAEWIAEGWGRPLVTAVALDHGSAITSIEAGRLVAFCTDRVSPGGMRQESRGPSSTAPSSVVTVICPSNTT